MLHEVKTVNPFFNDQWDKKKNFVVRKNNRDYRVKDIFVSTEFNSEDRTFTERVIYSKIVYVLDNPDFCKEGFVILGLKEITRSRTVLRS